MDNKIETENLDDEKYLALYGVRKETFDAMLTVLKRADEKMRNKAGRKRKLSVFDILIILFGYHHDNRTMESFALEYGVHKQRISEYIAWAEQTLSENGSLVLPSKPEPLINGADISNKSELFELIKENPISLDNI